MAGLRKGLKVLSPSHILFIHIYPKFPLHKQCQILENILLHCVVGILTAEAAVKLDDGNFRAHQW